MAESVCPADALVGRLARFVRDARQAGWRVGVPETLDMARLAESGQLWDRQQACDLLRAVLCQDRGDWERFPEFFHRYWRAAPGQTQPVDVAASLPGGGTAGISGSTGPLDDDTLRRMGAADPWDGKRGHGGAGDYEVLANVDFRFVWDDAQMRALEIWAERLARRLCRSASRRYRNAGSGERMDFRGTIRSSLRYGGWPMLTRYRNRREQARKLLLLVDVSQSMEVYSYFFLRFARALATAFEEFDAFAFHTRLVPIGDVLVRAKTADLNERLQSISSGWHGGTRIGASLEEFVREFGDLSLDARTVVVLVSDGYDTGKPEDLERVVAGIARRSRRLVWLNPLLGRPGASERGLGLPVEQGLKLALRHASVYAAAHSLDSLRRLERHLFR